MKNYLSFLAILVSCFAFSQQMSLSEEVVDFGNVSKGKIAESEITIKNTGSAPLVITNVKPSCGCTVLEWPKKPIMPGKSDQLKVSYNSNTTGKFNKVIEIFSNDKKSPRRVIRVQGKVN